MRKVVLTHWITFDGYKALDPDTEIRTYLNGVEDDEEEVHFVDRLNSVAEHAMGSITYGQMSEFWPQRDGGVAESMNRLPKLVFSSNPDLPTPWGPVRLITGDTATAIAELKAEEGGDILVHGGNIFVSSLLRLGLIDELRLTVLPVAIGTGVPLFDDLGRLQKFDLVGTTVFPSGLQEVVLAPATDSSGS